MPLGSNRGAQLKPQPLSSAEITLGHILYIPGGGPREDRSPTGKMHKAWPTEQKDQGSTRGSRGCSQEAEVEGLTARAF